MKNKQDRAVMARHISNNRLINESRKLARIVKFPYPTAEQIMRGRRAAASIRDARDWFAGMALQGWMCGVGARSDLHPRANKYDVVINHAAQIAYEIADEMMKYRE